MSEEDLLLVMPIKSDGLQVMSGPGTQHAVMTTVYIGDNLVVIEPKDKALGKIGRQDRWIEIRTRDGVSGFINAQFVQQVTTAQAGTAPEYTPIEEEEKPPAYIISPVGHALAGIHGPADPDAWAWDGSAFSIVRDARMEAVKLLAGGDVGANVVNPLRSLGVQFILARLFAKFHENRSVESFVDEVIRPTSQLYGAGVRYFEVHNEPNIRQEEGMWIAWQNGREFGDFFVKARAQLKRHFPDALFGWPGVSDGPDASYPDGTPVRYEGARFRKEADFAMQKADFICMHTYWGHFGLTYQDSLNDVKRYADQFPDKVIFVTEFSNNNPDVDKADKGREYIKFYTQAKRQLPSNVGALFSFVLSSSYGFPHETWRDSPIPWVVGQRSG